MLGYPIFVSYIYHVEKIKVMQVVVTEEIKSSYTGQVLRKVKMINPALCVSTQAMAHDSSTLARSERNDCVVRAFMAALDTSYDSTHAWVKKNFNRVNRQGTYTSRYLNNIVGKVKNGKRISFYGASPSHDYLLGGTTFSVKKGGKVLLNPKYKKPTSYTLRSFIENHPTGSYVVIVEGHAVCVKGGRLYGNSNEGQYKINRRVHYAIECK
jgi:hypothetical protein